MGKFSRNSVANSGMSDAKLPDNDVDAGDAVFQGVNVGGFQSPAVVCCEVNTVDTKPGSRFLYCVVMHCSAC